MSFLNKIKTILFEEDPNEGEEVNLPPRYDEENNDNKDVVAEVEEIEKKVDVVTDDSRFKIKRDLEPSFDDDILSEVADSPVKAEVEKEPEVEKEIETNIFQAFDENEFEGAYSRLRKNEELAKEQRNLEERVREEKNNNSNNDRRVNDAFSATNTSDSLKRQEEGTKKFKPSPVLSPVFGVLNVNYTKEDIIDKKDGIKRERVSPIIKKKEEPVEVQKEVKKKEEPKVEPKIEKKEEHVEVDIDSVRKKAYGAIENIEKEAIKETGKDDDSYYTSVEITKEKKKPVVEEVKEEKKEPVRVEKISKDELPKEIVKEDNTSVEDSVDTNYVLDTDDEEESSKPVVLDDLEKTSTLQILDDIEKELNSIKPISKEVKNDDEIHDRAPSVENSDTLENDLFNLIDSMYESGEEDEND
jgi:hypothetical protein